MWIYLDCTRQVYPTKSNETAKDVEQADTMETMKNVFIKIQFASSMRFLCIRPKIYYYSRRSRAGATITSVYIYSVCTTARRRIFRRSLMRNSRRNAPDGKQMIFPSANYEIKMSHRHAVNSVTVTARSVHRVETTRRRVDWSPRSRREDVRATEMFRDINGRFYGLSRFPFGKDNILLNR